MADRKERTESVKRRQREAHPDLSEQDILDLEKTTMEKVNRTVSALEVAMAAWEGSTEKPDDLKEKIPRYKAIHQALSGWQAKAVRAFGTEDREARIRLIWEFVDICHAYLGGS